VGGLRGEGYLKGNLMKLFFEFNNIAHGAMRELDRLIRFLPDTQLMNKLVSKCVSHFLEISDAYKVRKYRMKNQSSINPLITVYVPTYNRVNILMDRAIPSVLSQTYQNFELIVVDDGSTDDTKQRIMSLKDRRIRYIKCLRDSYRYPNKSLYHWFAGPVIAANNALEHAAGEWIARIDDDDCWTNDHLRKLLDFALNQKYEFVSSHLYVKDIQGGRVVTAYDDPNDHTGIGATQTWLYRSYLKHLRYNIHCWRKSYFRTNDTDLAERFFKAGVDIGYLEEITAFINPRPDEDFVGSKAYIASEEKYQNFYNNQLK
jgi:glycosyltransferase involved in cell wall biosynthesis